MNILLVEDDIQLNVTIEAFLKFKNHTVTSLLDGEDALGHIDMIQYDMYIIDINLPNINGLDLVTYIRNKDLNSPIIMITASLEISNLQIAFKNGCNEYIKKPFHLEELEVRINNLLNQPKKNIITISPNVTYDLEYEELNIDGIVTKQRKKERRLLSILIQHINHTVNYDTIENYVWENEIRESYPLRQLVAELKKNFGKYEYLIETQRGSGYKIVEENN